MTPWRLVIAAPSIPLQTCESAQERQIQRLSDAAIERGAAVTLIAPRTRASIARAAHLLPRSRFLLRPVLATQDAKHREVITTWIEPPMPGPSRFLLDHPWFTELDRNVLPVDQAHVALPAAWALWSSAVLSLLSQLNNEIAVIHALGWQAGLVLPMARCVSGGPSNAALVYSPGADLPPAHLTAETRALLRVPPQAPPGATSGSLPAWGLAYAHAWDISSHDYGRLAADPALASLLQTYRGERLLPRGHGDPTPEVLERADVARYAAILAAVHGDTSSTPSPAAASVAEVDAPAVEVTAMSMDDVMLLWDERSMDFNDELRQRPETSCYGYWQKKVADKRREEEEAARWQAATAREER